MTSKKAVVPSAPYTKRSVSIAFDAGSYQPPSAWRIGPSGNVTSYRQSTGS